MNANAWRPNRLYDILIIGSGMGGSAVAHGLKGTGQSILMVERGGFIPQEKANWDAREIVLKRRYAAEEEWLDSRDRPFRPRIYYNVGGNSKFFGGSSFRLRESDFRDWPISYNEMAPWYDRAEELLGVRGKKGEDPCEPPRPEYPFAPVEHEPVIQALADSLRRQGLHPFHLPVAIDQGPEGRCRKGSPCDGFPCMVRAKGDAENRLLRPLLLRSDSPLTLLTKAYADRLVISADGRSLDGAVLRVDGKEYVQRAKTVVLSAGAVNSAALLLRSRDKNHPAGAANSSGAVGRYYMSHINSVMLALSLFRTNPTVFQKTLGINDFYQRGWGNIQLRGKILPAMLRNRSAGVLKWGASWIAPRSIDLWLMTEDTPRRENRVSLTDTGRIRLCLKQNNRKAHAQLVKAAAALMRKAGYPVIFTDSRDIRAVQHQCGTVRFGRDPRTSPLTPWCAAYDHPNLFVVDASFFPTSGAVNPALTIAAQGLRVASSLSKTL